MTDQSTQLIVKNETFDKLHDMLAELLVSVRDASESEVVPQSDEFLKEDAFLALNEIIEALRADQKDPIQTVLNLLFDLDSQDRRPTYHAANELLAQVAD